MKIKDFIFRHQITIDTILSSIEGTRYHPRKEDILNAITHFETTEQIKVIIIGQDPYHGENQAHGYAFSTLQTKLPPSLKNIFKELKDDLGYERSNGNLIDWVNQGVLLLNDVLTVKPNKPGSHSRLGWQLITNDLIKELSNEGNKIFVLWGNKAQEKKDLINIKTNVILETAHPSPLSAYKGFFGSKPFSTINIYLKDKIKW